MAKKRTYLAERRLAYTIPSGASSGVKGDPANKISTEVISKSRFHASQRCPF